MMVEDLFGEAPKQLDEKERRRQNAAGVPKGYAAVPGTGPSGKTCRDCEHYTLRSLAKTYRKCSLMKAYWTGGPGTDIKARSPACSRFEEKIVEQAFPGETTS